MEALGEDRPSLMADSSEEVAPACRPEALEEEDRPSVAAELEKVAEAWKAYLVDQLLEGLQEDLRLALGFSRSS